MKARVDQLLVLRGLAESREKAQALIFAGAVTVNGRKATKPGHSVADDASIAVAEKPPYVSRGGFKLAAALDAFAIDPTERVCLDTGASTGGFTDCLLQRGALRVHTVDVGATQLAWKLQTDARVVIHDHCNARTLTPGVIGEPVSLAVADLSFISTTLVLPAMTSALQADGELVVLVKPQFEVGRDQVGKGGIVRDPELHRMACDRVRRAVESLGFQTQIVDSPILGAEGNKEFLLHGRR